MQTIQLLHVYQNAQQFHNTMLIFLLELGSVFLSAQITLILVSTLITHPGFAKSNAILADFIMHRILLDNA
jgi:hypothetical protein